MKTQYRALNKETQQWEYGHLDQNNHINGHEIILESLGEKAYKKDKEGFSIYENDIIKMDFDYYHVVKAKNDFYLSGEEYGHYLLSEVSSRWIEIVGNSYVIKRGE